MRITIRVDKSLKESAEVLFEQLGMNMSTALNVFLRKAVDENAIPFHVSVKSSAAAPIRLPNTPADTSAPVDQNAVEDTASQNTPLIHNINTALPDATRDYVNRYGKPIV